MSGAEPNGNGDKTDASNAKSGDLLGGAQIAQIASAVASAVAIFTALAVTGKIDDAQRDHSGWLLVAVGFLLLGSVAWIGSALFPAKWGTQDPHKRIRRFCCWFFRPKLQCGVALFLYAAGVLIGVTALVLTARDTERPSVTASFNATTRVLSGTASADGLGSSTRLDTSVTGLTRRSSATVPFEGFAVAPTVFYYAEGGSGSDGIATQKFTVRIPSSYRWVVVKAWTGEGSDGICRADEASFKKLPPPARRGGCLIIDLSDSLGTSQEVTATAFWWFNKAWTRGDLKQFELAASKHGLSSADLQALLEKHPVIQSVLGIAA